MTLRKELQTGTGVLAASSEARDVRTAPSVWFFLFLKLLQEGSFSGLRQKWPAGRVPLGVCTRTCDSSVYRNRKFRICMGTASVP